MGAVAVLVCQQLIQSQFGMLEYCGHGIAQGAQTRRANGYQQRLDRFRSAREVRQSLLDQLGSGQIAASHATESTSEARAKPAPPRLRRDGRLVASAARACIAFQRWKRGPWAVLLAERKLPAYPNGVRDRPTAPARGRKAPEVQGGSHRQTEQWVRAVSDPNSRHVSHARFFRAILLRSIQSTPTALYNSARNRASVVRLPANAIVTTDRIHPATPLSTCASPSS